MYSEENHEMDFKDHLRKQLGFLERSCISYDQGFHDESIRIATVLRVLIHNTKSSTSLLNHLNLTTLNLLSTSGEPHSPATFKYFGMGLMTMKGDGTVTYTPGLDRGSPVNDFVPVSKWWNQIVYVLNLETRLSRSKIILAAANKDGGAHIDKKLSPEYKHLASDGAIGSIFYNHNGNQSKVPIQDAHLVALRQMAYEILNSPELVSITNK